MRIQKNPTPWSSLRTLVCLSMGKHLTHRQVIVNFEFTVFELTVPDFSEVQLLNIFGKKNNGYFNRIKLLQTKTSLYGCNAQGTPGNSRYYGNLLCTHAKSLLFPFLQLSLFHFAYHSQILEIRPHHFPNPLLGSLQE